MKMATRLLSFEDQSLRFSCHQGDLGRLNLQAKGSRRNAHAKKPEAPMSVIPADAVNL